MELDLENILSLGNSDKKELHHPILIDSIEYLTKLKQNYNKSMSTHNSYDEVDIKNELMFEKSKGKINTNEYNRSWSKLTTSQKCKVINTFISEITEIILDDNVKMTYQRQLRYILISALHEQLITKTCDVDYDQENGKILKIHKLVFENNEYKLSPTPIQTQIQTSKN